MSKRSTKPSTNKPYVIAAVVVGALLLAYLFLLPSALAGSYKDKALPAQNKVAEKVDALNKEYQRPAFTKVDTTATADKTDYAAARTALTALRNELNQQQGNLTGFVDWPLMGMNGDYTAAATAAKDAKEWATKTRQMLDAAAADLDYFEKQNALDATYENVGDSFSSATGAETPAALAQQLDRFANEIQPALDESKKIQPTESLKKAHDAEIALGEKLVTQLRALAQATRTENADAATAAIDQLEATMTEADNAMNQSFIDYNRDATVNKLIAELKVLDRTLKDDFNRF